MDTKNVTINLTEKEYDPAIATILSKGLNFVHSHNLKATIKEVISGAESAI
jgi:hypothetical protein